MLAPSPAIPVPSQTRAIVLLAVAGFASQAMVRSADSLLPQIAVDFGVTVGAASNVVSAYPVAHGSMQLVSGPVGDRVGKYRVIAIATAFCAVVVFACGLTSSLPMLLLARVASGMGAAWIIPLGMAYIGDVVPYDRRQQVLGRYMSGQIIGQLFGQAAGGVIGDAFGWRAAFFIHAGRSSPLAAIALFASSKVQSAHRGRRRAAGTQRATPPARRRLPHRAGQPVRAFRRGGGVSRFALHVRRLRVCGRRFAPALRRELHAGRADRMLLRPRRG